LALDAAGNVFVVDGLSELTAASGYAKGLNFAPSGGAAFSFPGSLALDAAGNVFVTNQSSVVELIGLATPVLTPVQACLKKGKNVCLP
jgi:hypothetical protein